jgi:hypothetical protein
MEGIIDKKMSFSTGLQYSPVTGDPRTVNSLTSPVSTFLKNTVMQMRIQLLTNDNFTINVYQAALGHVDVLLATFTYQLTPNKTSNLVYNVCLPAGRYSVVFDVRVTSLKPTSGQPLFNFLAFLNVSNAAVCINSTNQNSTGKNCIFMPL